MSVTSGFFDSLNGDRRYSAGQFSALFDNLITDGVFANVGTAFQVTASGDNMVTVGIGRAWFNSVWLYNDALLPMVAQDPEVLLNRIDAIVIEVNHNEAVRQASIRWVYGSPSSNPVRPTLTNTDTVHQYPLVYVYRKAGDSTVIQADITNMIGTSSCPYVTGILETQNIDKVVAQWESQFYTWFDGLETSLSGDVTANLANQVLDLQSRFQTLAREKAVYEELQDSTGATIQDSNGGDILARTVLGGETVIINYPSGGGDQSDVNSFEVGDTLTTARTDLDSRWVLCNGAVVDRTTYPELAAIIPNYPNGTFNKITPNSTANCQIGKVVYGGGYYVAPFSRYNGTTLYAAIAYKTSLTDNWTIKDLLTTNWSQNVIDIIYANGKFVALVSWRQYPSYSSQSGVTIMTATNPGGTWSSVALGQDKTCNGARLKFLDPYFVAIWNTQNTDTNWHAAKISYTSNPDGPWTTADVLTNSGMNNGAFLSDIIYVQGQYVAVGYKGQSAVLMYGSNLGSLGNTTTLFSGDGATDTNSQILYDGKYFIARFSTGSSMKIYYFLTPSGTKTAKEIIFDSSQISGHPVFRDILYHEGCYILPYSTNQGNLGLFYTTDLIGGTGYNFKLLQESIGTSYVSYTFGSLENNILIISYYMGSTETGHCALGYIDMSKMSLPSVSVSDSLYIYIKVANGIEE